MKTSMRRRWLLESKNSEAGKCATESNGGLETGAWCLFVQLSKVTLDQCTQGSHATFQSGRQLCTLFLNTDH